MDFVKGRNPSIAETDRDGAFYAGNRTWLSPEFRDWNIDPRLGNVSRLATVVRGRDDEYETRGQIDALLAGLGEAPEIPLMQDC